MNRKSYYALYLQLKLVDLMRFLLGLHIFFFLFTGLILQAQVDFTASTRKSCVPFEVKFAIDTGSYDISTILTAEWDFGNGQTATADATDTVTTTYTEEGLYTVALTINGDTDNTVRRSGFINALEALDSDFSIEFLGKDVDTLGYKYRFEPQYILDLSDTVTNYHFIWEHTGEDLDRRIVYLVDNTNPEDAIEEFTYPDTGLYTASLTIRQFNPDYVCTSVTSKDLLIAEEFVVPNVFSPTSTDYFIVDPEKDGITLDFQLFSRTGIKVFEQKAPIIYWDGRTNSGLELGTGVYFYAVQATGGDPEGFYTKKGFIHLFR